MMNVVDPLALILNSVVRSKESSGQNPVAIVISSALWAAITACPGWADMTMVELGMFANVRKMFGIPFRVQPSGAGIWCATIDAGYFQ